MTLQSLTQRSSGITETGEVGKEGGVSGVVPAPLPPFPAFTSLSLFVST